MARRTAAAMKDEGLIFTFLKCLKLEEARKLWNVQRLFLKVLDSKVIPLLALYERDWDIICHYMNASADGVIDGHPRFEYNYDNIAIDAMLHQDFEGLRVLSSRRYNFNALCQGGRLRSFAKDSLQRGSIESLFILRAIGYDYSEVLAECEANGEISSDLLVDRSITIEFFGNRSVYRSSVLDFAGTDYVERELRALCSQRERISTVPYIMAAFMRAGASPCLFLKPESCGYLLILALVSESFNFVYLLAKEAIHLEAIFEHYRRELLLIIRRALDNCRFGILDLLAFCNFKFKGDEEHQQFDKVISDCLRGADLVPIDHLCRIGLSLLGFAERNPLEFHSFVQSRLGQMQASIVAPEDRGRSCSSAGVLIAIRHLLKLDRRALELHFRSRMFLDFVGTLLSRRCFVGLRQIVEAHSNAMQPYFVENFVFLEGLLLNAFHTRDITLIVDLASLYFPMARMFARQQAEIDNVLLGVWLESKTWTELIILKNEVWQCSFPALFDRNQERSDAFVLKIIQNGYWFDLHNLASLSFDFPAFFNRCFTEVSEAVLSFIASPHPHFVLLRELSALSFPWERFMEAHCENVAAVRDHDFLDFVISLNGFELGSKVYGLVEQTCRLYHSMATSMFNSSAGLSVPVHAARSRSMGCLQEATAEDVKMLDPAEDRNLASWRVTDNFRWARVRSSPSLMADVLRNKASGSIVRGYEVEGWLKLDGESGYIMIVADGLPLLQRDEERISVDGPNAAARENAQPMLAGASSSSSSSATLPRVSTPSAVRGRWPRLPVKARPCREDDEAGEIHRRRLEDLVKRIRRKQFSSMKVVMLMTCKGAYCWNPLRLLGREVLSDPTPSHSEDKLGKNFLGDGKETSWSDIEAVLNFFDSKDDGWAPFHNQLPPHHFLPAAPGQLPHGAAMQAAVAFHMLAAPVLQPPGAVPPPGIAAMAAQLGVPMAVPPPPAAGDNARPLVSLHMACLAQPGEERVFRSKLDLFWDILLSVLPSQ